MIEILQKTGMTSLILIVFLALIKDLRNKTYNYKDNLINYSLWISVLTLLLSIIIGIWLTPFT